MKRLAYILPLLILALVAYAWLAPTAPAERPVYVDVPATPTYPACTTEDGAGQALCMWDAAKQGNGMGKSIISGDCAPEYVGGQAASDECVITHTMDSTTRTDADGFAITIPNGADLVAECNDIENEAKNDKTIRNELNNDGWNLIECYKAQRHS